MANLVEAGSHDLRLAAKAVWVLHFVAIGVGHVDRRSIKEHAVRGCRVDLASMAAKRVNPVVERFDRTHRAIDRECASNERGTVRVLDREQIERCDGSGKRRELNLELQR